jgi:hypothetical protein
MMDRSKSLAQNIDAIFFSPNAELKDEFSDLYQALFKNAGPHIKVITALSAKGMGLTRKEILAAAGLTDNGAFSTVLEELENCGFIRKYSPFGSNISLNRKRQDSSSLYQLIDFYTLFYFRFIEKNSYQDEHFWTTSVNSPLRGKQQLAGGALGVGGRQHVMQAGAEAQQQLARAEAACVEVDLAAHGHPVSFVCERSCFLRVFKKKSPSGQRQLVSNCSTSGQKWRAGSSLSARAWNT